MAFKNISDFILQLEKAGELLRIKQVVNSEFEITEITDRISKTPGGGKALLFENTGTQFPVLINALGSEKRMALALGVTDLELLRFEFENILKLLSQPRKDLFSKLRLLPQLKTMSSWMPKYKSSKGACQEVVIKNPDLSQLPILKCWPADGGRFITFPMVITKDPETGMRNVGMYRMQVFDKNTTGMHWHKHKTGARHYNLYKERKEIMPVSVALGGDPAHTFSATAPLPDNMDEFLLSGFLRKKSVELVKCITNNLEVPADADFVLEGYVDPTEELAYEGPFGDHTGFYSLADYYPKFHITCITHKKNAVYPATIVGIPPMEDAYIAKATERIFLTPIKLTMVPEMIDYDMPTAGVAHNLAIVSIKKTYPGQALKVINSLWGAGQMMFNKILVIVDETIDVHNYTQVAQAISLHANPADDIVFGKGPLDVLDHAASKLAFGGKMGIDATPKMDEELTLKLNKTQILDRNKTDQFFEDLAKENIQVNNSFIDKAISFMVCSIKKQYPETVKNLADKIFSHPSFALKFVLFVDDTVAVQDIFMTLWVAMNNMDPERDKIILKDEYKTTLFLDGTAKKADIDYFKRDWPNAVLSSEETIKRIDSIWETLEIGDFIESPSLKYARLVKNSGPIAL